MKKVWLMFILLFVGALFARETGFLSSGQEVVVTPKDGHSLNVERVFGSDANFDITMSNKGVVYYSAKNQTDNIYLVFHNDVLPGDRIKIHINKGEFKYSFSTVGALPKVVKKALYKKAQVLPSSVHKKPKRAHKVKHKKRKKRKIHKKEEPILGEFVEETKPTKQAVSTPKRVLVEPKPKNDKLNSPSDKKVLNDTFYGNFTKIFEGLLKSFSLTPSQSETAKSVKKSSQNETKTVKKQKEIKEPKKQTKTTKPSKTKPKQIDKDIIVHEATMIRGNFDALPKEIEPVKPKRVLKPKPVAKSENSQKIDKKTPPAPQPKEQIRQNIEVKNRIENTPTLQKELPVAKTQNRIITPKVEQKTVSPTIPYTPSANIQKRLQEEPAYSNESAIDTGYKEGFEDLNKGSEKEPKEELVDNSNENKIVITKILDKNKPQTKPKDIFEGRVLGKMSDRVLGGGYDPDAEVSKFGVRATKNSLPVSAWIEVFKNGTKQRIKTFYTSTTNKTKKVKLPAGVYMIRATYRTRDGKLQKTIKNIHLKEGGDITKHITFNEGRLKVVATRGGRPLYVKVSVYKSGTKDRVNYDFSDRHTGVAGLSLPVGTYDIEVVDHKNVKNFDDVRISASSTQTLNIDF